MQDKLFSLIDLITTEWVRCLPYPWGSGEFTPNLSTTFCNEYVAAVCRAYGNDDFYNAAPGSVLLANGIYEYVNNHPEKYLLVSGSAAQFSTNTGLLTLAAWKNPNPGHGHVSIVYPGTLGTSGHWNSNQVPKLANVGEDKYCRIGIGANWCFSEEPLYFVIK